MKVKVCEVNIDDLENEMVQLQKKKRLLLMN